MEKQKSISCNYCRQKHLKCNAKTPCEHCKRNSQECIRVAKRYRFSKTKRSDARREFSDDQTWVATRNSDNLSFIDVMPQQPRTKKRSVCQQEDSTETSGDDIVESSRAFIQGRDDDTWKDVDAIIEDNNDDKGLSTENESSTTAPPSLPRPEQQCPQLSYNNSPAQLQHPSIHRANAQNFSTLSPAARSDSALQPTRLHSNQWRADSQLFVSPQAEAPASALFRRCATSPLDTALQSRVASTALRGLPDGITEDSFLQIQEACLMRHFVQNLAPWVSDGCITFLPACCEFLHYDVFWYWADAFGRLTKTAPHLEKASTDYR